MSLPCPVAPYKATIVLVFNPLTTRQLQYLRLGELRQDTEIIDLEVLQDRKLRVFDPPRDRSGSAGCQLGLGETEQELEVVLIGRGGVPCKPLELPAHRRQPQLPETALQQIDRGIGHRKGPFLDSKGMVRARQSSSGSINFASHHAKTTLLRVPGDTTSARIVNDSSGKSS